MRKKITFLALGALSPLYNYAAEINNQGSSIDVPSSFLEGNPLSKGSLTSGYNHSANYKPSDRCGLYMTANYIYWHVNQWPLIVGNLVHTKGSGSKALFNGTAVIQSVQPGYRSGFQIGSGYKFFSMDDWNLYGEYTWYQNNCNKSVKSGSNTFLSIPDFFKPGIYGSRVLTATKADGNFSFHYNSANLCLERPFYFSERITANIALGLKGLWISESVGLVAKGLSYGDPLTSDDLIPEPGTLVCKNHRKSWGVGPRFAFTSNWLLGCGLQLVGDLGASVLYTRYTKHDTSAVTSLTNITSFSQSNYGTLRAVTESSLGLGWGQYLGGNNRWHLDLTASYDFNILWNQNIIVAGASSNIYIHGLNLGARFDF